MIDPCYFELPHVKLEHKKSPVFVDVVCFLYCFWVTPLKMNIEHKSNEALEDDFPFPGLYSHLPCLIFRGVEGS